MADRTTTNDMPDWAPPQVDLSRPNTARVYDYFLGGFHNFEVDRAHAEIVEQVLPQAPDLARRARRFLRSAIDVLARDYKVDQFLDLGSGIPTVGNVDEIARKANPSTRVVYVDNEPVAVASGQLITEGIDGVEVINADFTQPKTVLEHPITQSTLDFTRPIAVIYSCTLHLVPDEQKPADIVATYRDATAPGSWMVIAHGTGDNGVDMQAVQEKYKQAGISYAPRNYREVEALCAGYELVEPGLVFTDEWRPESTVDPEKAKKSGCYAGVGQRR